MKKWLIGSVVMGTGALLKLQHSSFADIVLICGLLTLIATAIIDNHRKTLLPLLLKFRWYFGCSALVLYGMDMFVRSGAYRGNKGILAGACIHALLFIAGFFVGRKKIIKA